MSKRFQLFEWQVVISENSKTWVKYACLRVYELHLRHYKESKTAPIIYGD
jgi:hypothetical protein